MKTLHCMRRLLITIFALGFFVNANAQLVKPTKIFINIDKKEAKVGDTLTLTAVGEIIEGFYMYGSQFPAEGPIKTHLEFDKFEGLKAVDSLTCTNCKTKRCGSKNGTYK